MKNNNFTNIQKKLYRKNLKFFSAKFPELFSAIAVDLPVNVQRYYENNDLDILINGNRFYGIDAYQFVRKQVDAYVEKPSFMECTPPYDLEERTPMHFELQREHNKRLKKHKIVASPSRQRFDTATTFVFGAGLGLHIYPIVVETRCNGVVVVEPEPLFLILSMYFTDWAKLYKILKGRLDFVVEADPEKSYRYCRHIVHAQNVGVQQSVFHFKHYSSPAIDSVFKYFLDKCPMFFDGLGFYDDEKQMLRNHMLNMYDDTWKLCQLNDARLIASCVVVGAGPSLDNDISWLKENQDKVIIFSGGSALPTLLKNGIIPDFHVEIENIAMNYDLLSPLVKNYDLSNTVLICSSTMDARAARLFSRRLWFMREGVASSYIFTPNQETLLCQNPTVINTAMSSAISLGFKNILMLGADFGTLNVEKHHSSDSFYDFHEELKSAKFTFPDITPANFGGNAYTNAHYLVGLYYIERLVSIAPGVSIYNGSNGARVPGTTPIRSNRYRILPLMLPKEMLKEKLYNNSKEVDWESLYGKDIFLNIEERFEKYITLLASAIKKASRRQKNFIVFLQDMYSETQEIDEDFSVFNPMLNGTINTHTIFIMFWWARIRNDELSKFEIITRNHWKKFPAIVKKNFEKFIESVRQELPLARPELFDDKGVLISDKQAERDVC